MFTSSTHYSAHSTTPLSCAFEHGAGVPSCRFSLAPGVRAPLVGHLSSLLSSPSSPTVPISARCLFEDSHFYRRGWYLEVLGKSRRTWSARLAGAATQYIDYDNPTRQPIPPVEPTSRRRRCTMVQRMVWKSRMHSSPRFITRTGAHIVRS